MKIRLLNLPVLPLRFLVLVFLDFLLLLVSFLLQLMDSRVWCEGFAPQTEENSEFGEIEVFEVGEQDAPLENFSSGPLHQKNDIFRR